MSAAVRLSVAIMTHPARLHDAQRIAGQHREWNLRLACDPSPELPPATLRTARVAWRMVEPGATHHMVIQDDVILPPRFFEHVAAAVATHPASALCFFAEWGSRTATTVRVAALRGASWAEVFDWYVPTQALVLPADVARGVDEQAATEAADTPDDHVLGHHLQRLDIGVYVSVPNLLQHADAPSVMGYQAAMGLRRSACYSPELAAAGVADGPVLAGLADVPHFRWWDRRAECVPRPPAQGKRSTRSWLHAKGVPASRLRAPLDLLDASFIARIGETVLTDLWLTAFATGLIAGQGEPALDERALTSPAAALALRSLAPGSLRLLTGPDELDSAGEALEPFVRGGVSAGIDAGARCSR
jgi:hypothetical protein